MVRHLHRGIGLPGDEAPDVTVDLVVEGEDEDVADKVLLHAKDAAVRALQAYHEGQHPEDCDGIPLTVDWDAVVEQMEGND